MRWRQSVKVGDEHHYYGVTDGGALFCSHHVAEELRRETLLLEFGGEHNPDVCPCVTWFLEMKFQQKNASWRGDDNPNRHLCALPYDLVRPFGRNPHRRAWRRWLARRRPKDPSAPKPLSWYEYPHPPAPAVVLRAVVDDMNAVGLPVRTLERAEKSVRRRDGRDRLFELPVFATLWLNRQFLAFSADVRQGVAEVRGDDKPSAGVLASYPIRTWCLEVQTRTSGPFVRHLTTGTYAAEHVPPDVLVTLIRDLFGEMICEAVEARSRLRRFCAESF